MLAEYTFTRPTLHDVVKVVQHFDHVLHHPSFVALKKHIPTTGQHGGKSNMV